MAQLAEGLSLPIGTRPALRETREGFLRWTNAAPNPNS